MGTLTAHRLDEGSPARATRPEWAPLERREIGNSAIAGGAAIIVLAVLAGWGALVAVEGLITKGDAGRTAADIAASLNVFRLGIAALFVVIALDVVAAVALYRVFSPVSKGVSMLAAAMRLAFAGVFMIAIGQLLGVLRLLSNDDYLKVFSADELNAQVLLGVNAFTDMWQAALFLFGAHLLVLGYLALRSGFAPRFIGVLLVISGVGYSVDSLVSIFSSTAFELSTVTFAGEFLLAVWLVIWGRRIRSAQSPQQAVAIVGTR